MGPSTGLTFSTDVLGLFAQPSKVTELYSAVGFDPQISGIELVLMPPQMESFNDLTKQKPKLFNLNGVHGKLGVKEMLHPTLSGFIDWAKVITADLLLPPINGYHKFLPAIPVGLRVDMIGQITERDIYFNVHNDNVKNDFPTYLDYARFAAYSHLSVENGGRNKDLEETAVLVDRMRQQGATSTTGTFDLVHAVKAETDGNVGMNSINKVWGVVLGKIGDVFKHLHLPIGEFSETGDSLPILDMICNGNHRLIQDLATIVKEKNIAITFENQHNLLLGANIAKETERLKRIRTGLIECGLEV
jgi:hypothetical protein